MTGQSSSLAAGIALAFALGALAIVVPGALLAEGTQPSGPQVEAEAEATAGSRGAETSEKRTPGQRSDEKAAAGEQTGCRASARSSASATASDGQVTRHVEKQAQDSGDGCSASSYSSATARSSGSAGSGSAGSGSAGGDN